MFHYFDIVICTNNNILNQFLDSENFKTLRQQMRSHGSNVSPGFPISGDGCHTTENCLHQVGVEPLLVKVSDHFLVINWRSSIMVFSFRKYNTLPVDNFQFLWCKALK